MLTYADVCGRMRTYADVCGRMRTYADDTTPEELPHAAAARNEPAFYVPETLVC